MFGLSKKVTPFANEIVQDAAIRYVREIVSVAPVDTGLTVSSWKVGLNYTPTGTRLFVPGKLGSTATANRAAVLGVLIPRIKARVTGQTISIVNETPYLQYINKGEYQAQVSAAFKNATVNLRQKKLL